MAYSPIEQAYIDGIVSAQFPDPEPEPVMLADSSQVKSDAQQGFGTIGPIPRNKAQEALGYVGELLTKAGVELDKVGLDVPVLGRITLKDLTVGESGKVLEDMSYGFMPVEGAGGFISGTTRIKPDAALELMNIAPAVGAAAKLGGKAAVKGVTKAVETTKGMPVGLSVKEVGQGVDELGFYSAASKAVDSIQQPKGTGDQFLKQIEKTPGVKPDEIKWTGLDDFLKSKKTVTKQEVQDYMAANRVEVKEVNLGEPTHEWQGNFLVIDKTAVAKIDETADGSYVLRDNINNKETPLKSNRLDKAVAEAEDIYGVKGLVTPYEGKPKFDKYTLPGGKNYREVLLTLPSKNPEFDPKDIGRLNDLSNKTRTAAEDVEYKALAQRYDASLRGETNPEFKSSHFDQPNILAHLRVNDRVDVDGKKVLFVEEVQSDWHQAGRKRGYSGDIKKELEAINAERTALIDTKLRYEKLAEPYVNEGKDAPQNIVEGWTLAANRLQSLQMRQDKLSVGVPDAPFKTNWQELAMKRAIQLAAEGGYDRIAFTTGAQQAARYDLSKQIDYLELIPNTTGNGKPFALRAFKEGSNQGTLINQSVNESELEDLIGKDLAKKLIEQKPTEFGDRSLSGVDLQVGGDGMKGFYDNILPKFLDKYGKKWDAKTGMTKIRLETDAQAAEDAKLLRELGVDGNGKSAASVHYIDITPKMRESVVTEGQPLFAVGAGAGAAATQKEESK